MRDRSLASLDFADARGLLARLADSTALHLAVLLLLAVFVNRAGDHIPTGNEYVYLLYVFKAWHPAFLATDWTFQEPTAGHAFFNHAVGWMTRLMSMEATACVGRVVCWVACYVPLLRIGRRYGLPPWLSFFGVLLWVAQRQSFVTEDWVVGSFEAKCAGYACLLWALDGVLAGGSVWTATLLPAALTGLSFSFHTAVGLWGGAALGLAVLLTRPVGQTALFAGVAVFFSLPGLIPSLALVHGPHQITGEEARFLATRDMPALLDPMTFGAARMAILAAMFVFAAWHFDRFRDDRFVRVLFIFETAAAAFFCFGVVARVIDRFDWVILYPLRTYAVFVMVLFFWQLLATLRRWAVDRPAVGNALPAFGVALFLCLPGPVVRVMELAKIRLPELRQPDDDFITAAKWVAANVPAEGVVVAPPWRRDAFYYTAHPLVASWHAPRYDAMTEWRQRIADQVGDMSGLAGAENLDDLDEACREHYDHLTGGELSRLQQRYGAQILVTRGDYQLPRLFRHGVYSVFQLSAR